MQIREIMTANPACCTPDTGLREIAQMMVEHDCGLIPVVNDLANKKPIGTITDRDITIRAFTTGGNPAEMKASDVMTMGVTTVSPDISVQECADVMEDKKIRRILVVDENGRCSGIVAQADIAEYGPNPALISDLVHEISESESSPNRGGFNKVRTSQSYSTDLSNPTNQSFRANMPTRKPRLNLTNRSFSRERTSTTKESLFGINSLLPLLAGIGIAAGAKYYFDSNKENKRIAIERLRSRNEAELSRISADKTRDDLPKQTEIHSFTAEDSVSTNMAFSNEDVKTNTDTEISRTAGQG